VGAEQVPQAVASYPFVSVAAAAMIVAMLIKAACEQDRVSPSTLFSMNLGLPQEARVGHIQISERCLLLCGEPYLEPVIGRVSNV
jgi:hypothetical protein